MATKVFMQSRPTDDAQRVARILALHRRLLTAAERLTQSMKRIDTRAYEADAADVLALRVAVENSTRLFLGRERIS